MHTKKQLVKGENWSLNMLSFTFINCQYFKTHLLSLGGITVSIIAFVFTIKFLCELAARVVSFLQNDDPARHGDRSIYDYVRGNYLDPRSCKVSWDWKEPQEVGQTMSFRVQVTNYKIFSKSCCIVSTDSVIDYILVLHAAQLK